MTEIPVEAKTSAASIYSRELKKDIPFPSDQDALLTEVQAAAFVGVTRRALQAWRISGKGPKYARISARCIRYRKCDLVEWSEARLVRSTSEVPA